MLAMIYVYTALRKLYETVSELICQNAYFDLACYKSIYLAK